jgi:RNA polymerase-binding transcription factor DksA
VNNPAHWAEYRQLLLAKQEELLAIRAGRMVSGAAGGLAGDLMDQALAESAATLDAHLNQAKSGLLRAIESALVRLKNGNYGICSACGEAISGARPR